MAGLIPRSGSLTQTSPLPNEQVPVKTTDLLDLAPFVERPAHERLAFDTDTYVKATKDLQGYLSGHRHVVTYYHNAADGGKSITTQIQDLATERHPIHGSYTRIKNFELTLPEPWDRNYLQEKSETEIRGTAYTYPGFMPTIGDVFFDTIGDGVWGKFVITSSVPMSWRRERAHTVTYSLNQVDHDGLLKSGYDAMVTADRVFDKETFLADVGTLLYAEEYKQLQTLRMMRPLIVRHYYKTFFDRALDSIFPVPGMASQIYDPYIAQYMIRKVSFDVAKVRPRQLWSDVDQSYKHTIWDRLEDRFNLSVRNLWAYQSQDRISGQTNDALFTTLYNRWFVRLYPNPESGGPGADGYLLGTAFYTNDVSAMSVLAGLIYRSITTRQLSKDDLVLFIQRLQAYQDLSLDEQYWQLPMYLHLIDVGIATLTKSRGPY